MKDLKIDKKEVAEIKWFKTHEIIELVRKGLTVTFSDELINCIKEK